MKLQNTIVTKNTDRKEGDFEIIKEVLKDIMWRRLVNTSRRFGEM